ncbi:MAG TPA: ATP-binding protein, partial [Stellaceae bacterium]
MADAVYVQRVDTMFRQLPIALGVNLVNAALTAAVLAPLSARLSPLPWFASVVLVTAVRWWLWLRCRQTQILPENAHRWSQLATLAALAAGLAWGIGGAVLFPGLSVLGRVFITTVIGGMCAGAVVTNAPHLPTLLAFVLGATSPMAIRFLTGEVLSDRALGAMVIIFAVALTLAGRHLSQVFSEAFRLRFELNEANLRLQAEMAGHRATEAALHQAQRLEAVGHLTGGIAHDFNNLLTVVVGNATLLHEEAGEEPTKRRALAILRIAERGERLTRQLLAFSRRRTLRPEAIGLQERAAEFAELLSRTLREDIELTIDLPKDLWAVAVDPGEFELALINIGVNARDAMPGGGKFRLAARNRGREEGPLSGGSVGDFVAVTLSDTGTGMPADVLAHAFEPYFTTKDPGFGSGLGLSQVYGFASQSGGAAEIASEPGHGTAITLFLPRAGTAQAVPVGPSAVAPLPAARILLVEDDAEVAATTRELLRSMGFEARWAQDGKAALALVEGGSPVD